MSQIRFFIQKNISIICFLCFTNSKIKMNCYNAHLCIKKKPPESGIQIVVNSNRTEFEPFGDLADDQWGTNDQDDKNIKSNRNCNCKLYVRDYDR